MKTRDGKKQDRKNDWLEAENRKHQKEKMKDGEETEVDDRIER